MNNPDIKGAITDTIKALELVEIVYDAWNVPSQHCERATQALTKLQALVEAVNAYPNNEHQQVKLLKEAISDE